MHRTAADALAARGEERHVEEIAHHLSEAGDERAAEYLRRAGEHALAMLAYEEAAELFARALEAAEERGPLLLARGDALLRAGEPAAARAAFGEAAALARRAGDAELLARAALGYAGLAVTIIDLDEEAVALLEEALADAGGCCGRSCWRGSRSSSTTAGAGPQRGAQLGGGRGRPRGGRPAGRRGGAERAARRPLASGPRASGLRPPTR